MVLGGALATAATGPPKLGITRPRLAPISVRKPTMSAVSSAKPSHTAGMKLRARIASQVRVTRSRNGRARSSCGDGSLRLSWEVR